jgi:biotin carboxylase
MVLGGNLYSEPSIRSLKSSGYRVVLVDGNPDAPGFAHADAAGVFSFRETEKCLALARKEGVIGLLPTHDMAVVPSAVISEEMSLKGPSVEAARRSVSKHEMRKVWKEYGLHSPDFIAVNSLEDFKGAVRRIGFPAICKPTGDVGGGSRGVMKIDESTNLDETFVFATSYGDNGEVLVEPFYEGREHSVELLLKGGEGSLLMVADKIQTQPPYRVGKSLKYPSSVTQEILGKIEKISISAAKAIGIHDGAAHIELVSLPDGEIILFEIGLRCGGGAIPHPVATAVTGINQFVEFANILTGDSNGVPKPEHQKPACWHFITAEPGKLKSVAGFDEASAMEGIIASGLDIKPGDTIMPLKTSSDRLGYFVSVGDTVEEAYQKALKAESMLKFVYEG